MAWDSLSHELEHAAMAGDAVRGDGRAHSLRRARFARHDLLLLPINRIQCIRKRCALQHQNLCPDFALSCLLLCSRSPSALARAHRRRSSLLATDTHVKQTRWSSGAPRARGGWRTDRGRRRPVPVWPGLFPFNLAIRTPSGWRFRGSGRLAKDMRALVHA